MILFFETGFNNQKIHIILHDGMQIGQVRRLYETRYGQRAIVQNLKKEVDDALLQKIMIQIQRQLGIKTFNADGTPRFVDSGISTVEIF